VEVLAGIMIDYLTFHFIGAFEMLQRTENVNLIGFRYNDCVAQAKLNALRFIIPGKNQLNGTFNQLVTARRKTELCRDVVAPHEKLLIDRNSCRCIPTAGKMPECQANVEFGKRATVVCRAIAQLSSVIPSRRPTSSFVILQNGVASASSNQGNFVR